jgi:hypothetical protein
VKKKKPRNINHLSILDDPIAFFEPPEDWLWPGLGPLAYRPLPHDIPKSFGSNSAELQWIGIHAALRHLFDLLLDTVATLPTYAQSPHCT